MEHDVDALLQRYEMGQAYKRITAEMGPSPQLVAFVNYDKITSDSLGLESFDISAKHELILSEIERDNSLDLACEGLIDKVKSAGSRIKIAATLNKHARDLDKFVNAKLEPRDNNVNVTTHANFDKNRATLSKVISLAEKAMSKAPKTHDLEAWGKFDLAGLQDIDGDLQDPGFELTNPASKVKFSASGWTAESFKSGIKAYQTDEKKSEVVLNKLESYLDDLETFISHAKRKKDTKSLKSMRWISGVLNDAAGAIDDGTGTLWQTMNDVAQHFKVVE